MVKKKYYFEAEEILEIISLYEARIPVRTIAALYNLKHKINDVTLWHYLKTYEKLGLMRFRTRSETVLTTLSKKKTNPSGEKENEALLYTHALRQKIRSAGQNL